MIHKPHMKQSYDPCLWGWLNNQDSTWSVFQAEVLWPCPSASTQGDWHLPVAPGLRRLFPGRPGAIMMKDLESDPLNESSDCLKFGDLRGQYWNWWSRRRTGMVLHLNIGNYLDQQSKRGWLVDPVCSLHPFIVEEFVFELKRRVSRVHAHSATE